MSNARRLVIVVAALALAVAAFFVFRPEDTTQRDDPVRTEAPRNGDTEREPVDAGGGTPGDDDSTAEPPAEPAFEEIRIAHGGPVGKARTVAVESGDTVRLAFRSDAAGEVHIHGYDRYVDLRAGRTVRTRFPAELEGIFEMEDHGSGALLAKLRVEP